MHLRSLGLILLVLIAGISRPAVAAVQAVVTSAGAAIPGSPAALLADAKSTMPVDPAEAGRLARAAELLATKLPMSKARTVTLATALWLRGESLQRLNQAAAAVPLIEAALKSVAAESPPIKLQGDLLQTRAGIKNSLGQPQAALADYQQAYAIFGKVGAARSQAVSFQNIGNIYLEANDLTKVAYYYKLADDKFPNDPMLALSRSANLAGALYAAGRFNETESEYRRAYSLALRLHNPTLEIQLLNSLARTQRVLGKLDAADKSLAQAVRLWEAAPAAALAPMLFQTRAELALASNHPAAAVAFVERALNAAGSAASTRPYWQLQYAAYRIYAEVGDTARALAHFEVYQKLDNQSRELAASTSAALMTAQFDFANQNARIAILKAGELERDIALAQLQARQNIIVLGSLLLIAVSIALVLAFYLRSLRRSRNAIQTVNAQLTLANAELHNALAAKSQFLATTSHEIRTPLNGILGMTQVLLADRTLGGVLRERIVLMQGAGETMRALVDDILDFAKMDAGKLELHPLETDLPRVLDEIVEFWRDRAAQQGLALTFDRGAAPERVMIDSRRLRQILANLLSNAIKFTPAGSVVLTVATVAAATGADTDPDVGDSKAPAAGERLRIAIADTGIGISETDQVAVFEKFRQLDSGISRRFGGTGLGLAISQMLAQAMGGDIELSSIAGAGSTFTLDLPLVRAVATVSPPVSLEPPASLAAARLLLVGASPVAQGVLRAVLTPRVASFAVAADIPAAIACLRIRSTDLVIIDTAVGDPGLDGDRDAQLVELTAAALAAPAALVVLSPNREPAERDRLLAAGVTAVIGKPVTSNVLTRELAGLFENAGDDGGSTAPVSPLELATT